MERTRFLQPEEFNQDFFDGFISGNQHLGGYWNYNQTYNEKEWKSIARIFVRFGIQSPALEVACAKGFLLKALRSLGVEIIGMDISPYAVEHAINCGVVVGDVRKDLQQFTPGQFATVISHQFFTMLSEEDVRKVVLEMNRVAKKQIHIIQEAPDTRFNISHPIAWWAKLPFHSGTVLIGEENNQNVAIV